MASYLIGSGQQFVHDTDVTLPAMQRMRDRAQKVGDLTGYYALDYLVGNYLGQDRLSYLRRLHETAGRELAEIEAGIATGPAPETV
jgi:hypothetical protein